MVLKVVGHLQDEAWVEGVGKKRGGEGKKSVCGVDHCVGFFLDAAVAVVVVMVVVVKKRRSVVGVLRRSERRLVFFLHSQQRHTVTYA